MDKIPPEEFDPPTERHRANLMAKLDVHDVAGLTRVAIEHGLIFVAE